MTKSYALITGGAGHIGSEVCRKLASKNVNIAIVDKNKQGAETLVNQLKTEFGVEAIFIDVNIIEPASFDVILETIQNKFGGLDYLINNAAFYDDIPGWGVPFEKEGYDAWMKVLQVNLMAPFFLVQKLAPLLKKSPMASVVNVSSIYGVVGPDHSIYEGLDMTNPAAYSASKSGLIGITKWLSTVLAPAIRVNVVTPGGLSRGQNDIFVKRYETKTPLKRMANENDVANSICFLLSNESSYITGLNLIVDGGWTVW